MNHNKLERDPALIALLAAFGLAIAHQYLFYGNSLGLSVPVFTGLYYLYVFRIAVGRTRHASGFGWFLFTVIGFLSLTFVLFDNPVFRALNAFVVPFLAIIHTTYLLSDRTLAWSKPRMIAAALVHLIPLNLRQWPAAFRIVRKSAGIKMGERKKHVISRVAIGLAIAVPMLIIIVNLLASADGVFHHVLSGIPAWMNDLSFGEGIVRCLWIVFFGLIFFGFLWGFIDRFQAPQEASVSKVEAEKSFKLDPIIITTVLITINIVYVLFVAIQFSYLFGAWEGVLPEGQTYAQYARSGFSELVAVSVINFAILISTLFYGGRDSRALNKVIDVMLYIVVGSSAVMLYSAYMRLVLYEEAYGYTYIRFLVHAFMIYLGVLIVVAGTRIRFQRLPLAKVYIVVSLLAFVTINYAGMDRFIAAKNIERYRMSGSIDAQYLSNLSSDAVPLLIQFNREEYPDLKNFLQGKMYDLSQGDRDWPSFNVSRFRAENALREALDK